MHGSTPILRAATPACSHPWPCMAPPSKRRYGYRSRPSLMVGPPHTAQSQTRSPGNTRERGSRCGSGKESRIDHRTLPSRRGCRRQPDRLRRRYSAQDEAPRAREHRHKRAKDSCQRHCALSSTEQLMLAIPLLSALQMTLGLLSGILLEGRRRCFEYRRIRKSPRSCGEP